jgi:hypothetical protein
MGDRKLYIEDAAQLAGVTAATWRGYCTEAPGRQRQAPAADGTDIQGGHARPWWWESTIEAWIASRPGRGAPGRTRGPRQPAPGR